MSRASAEQIPTDAKGLSFEEALTECLMNSELVAQFNRLWKTDIRVRAAPKHPIEAMVDAATGAPPIIWTPRERDAFIQFVLEYVWLPLCEQKEAS